jgi:CheY-like chemotaxis protein
LSPERSQSLALVLHELATNSAKYGALSTPEGILTIRWSIETGMLNLRWEESGGPPVTTPSSHGFGTKIMNASIKHQIGGNVAWDWRTSGLHCTLQIPLGRDGATGDAGQQAKNLVHLPSGTMKRILLVEDEAMIGMMMRELLSDYGMFVVGPCCSLNEALAEAAGDFDGAFLDLNLSGEFVYPVAERLRERNIPFAFVTGYDGATLDRRFDGVPILQKPITRECLELQLNGMLGTPVPATQREATIDPPSARTA